MWFYLINILIISAAIALEIHPNKYLANLLVLGKLWITFLAFCAFLMACGLSAKIRTRTNTNFARNLLTPKTGWRQIPFWTDRLLVILSVPLFVGLGQWWLAICTLVLILDVVVMKVAAREYMSQVSIDPETKAAVIDVAPK